VGEVLTEEFVVTQPNNNGGRSSPDAILELWQEYKDTAAPGVRDRLVLTLAPMVKYIVFRKLREIPARCEVEDFLSCGLEALIRCIDRYDPEKGATLEQFAWTRIHGAVIDELRRNDWAPRSLRRWERDIKKARERFIGLYHRTPTNVELSDALAISHAQLLRLLDDIAKADVGSLNTLVRTEDDTTIEQIDTLPSFDRSADPEYAAMRERAIERFRIAFSRLPVREREIAVLIHVNDLTLRETGDVLGISESRVCQIHGQLKRQLRKQLDAEQQLFSEVA
jgi:RNA polymerase sigma factor for flagellar operon FliA